MVRTRCAEKGVREGVIFGMIMFALASLSAANMVSAISAQDGTTTPDVSSNVKTVLEAFLEAQGVPGGAVAIIEGDRPVEVAVAGRRRNDRDDPIERDDPFHIGSCTKAFTSTLAAILIEDDDVKLDWSTTILEVFPEWREAIDTSFHAVTLEQLLSHRAGVMAFTQPGEREASMVQGLEGGDVEQRKAFVKRVLAERPIFQPGEGFEYSNAGYAVAAAMMERVTGASWAKLIRTRIFAPLGMTGSKIGFPASTSEETDKPWGHFARGNEVFIIPPEAQGATLPVVLQAAGDISCTIGDLATFVRMHMRGLHGEETRLLSADAIKRLHRAGRENYAMGWFSTDHWGVPATAHNGSGGLFFAWMVIVPEQDRAIVTMTNAGNGDLVCRGVTRALLEQPVDQTQSDNADNGQATSTDDGDR